MRGFSTSEKRGFASKASANTVAGPRDRQANRDWYSSFRMEKEGREGERGRASATSRLWSFSCRDKPIYRSFSFVRARERSVLPLSSPFGLQLDQAWNSLERDTRASNSLDHGVPSSRTRSPFFTEGEVGVQTQRLLEDFVDPGLRSRSPRTFAFKPRFCARGKRKLSSPARACFSFFIIIYLFFYYIPFESAKDFGL